jgi:GDP-L-fucose synthase
MKILVTGATGFLGKHLCPKLEANNNDVVKIGLEHCDLTVQNSLESYLKNHKASFDQIYHLAAWTQAGDFCLYHAGEQWIINQQINTNVLTYWKNEQPQAKMIAMGTSCSYDPGYELKEENFLKGIPIESLLTYAMGKRMLYTGLIALNKQFNLNYICFVPSTLYGSGYHTDGRQMHFIFDLIRKIIKGKKYGDPVVLWGDGYQKRELILVDDVVSIMIEIAAKHNNNIINIGAGEGYTIREFAKMICDKVGYDFEKIQFDTSKYVGARSKIFNVEKLKTFTNYKQTPLKQGLYKTIDWFYSEEDKLV